MKLSQRKYTNWGLNVGEIFMLSVTTQRRKSYVYSVLSLIP